MAGRERGQMRMMAAGNMMLNSNAPNTVVASPANGLFSQDRAERPSGSAPRSGRNASPGQGVRRAAPPYPRSAAPFALHEESRDLGRAPQPMTMKPPSADSPRQHMPQAPQSRERSASKTERENVPSAGRARRSVEQRGQVVSQGPSFPRTGTIAGAGAFEDMNAGFRHYMEDASVILPSFASPSGEKAFVAVYDGHGGRQAVDYIGSKLHEVLQGEMEAEPVVEKALVNTFHKVDGQLRLVGCFHTGSTATVAVVSRERQRTALVLANVGDSRAIAVRRDGHVSLTPDHKAVDPAEVQRIQQSGGSVHRGRVGGQLLVSRALGDIGLKSAGVIATPHTQTRDATDDLALIIASDGVWDVVPEQTAAQIVQSVAERELSAGNKNASKAATVAAERLVECAKQKGSGDNITALVLFY